MALSGCEYDSITAKAGEPITITFDNCNPAPFVFNIAVYRGNSPGVDAKQYLGGTMAYHAANTRIFFYRQEFFP